LQRTRSGGLSPACAGRRTETLASLSGRNLLITIAQTDAIAAYVVKSVEDFFLKPHVHKIHEGMVYVIKGTG